MPVMTYTNGTLRSPINFLYTNIFAGAGITFSFGNTNNQLTISMNGTNNTNITFYTSSTAGVPVTIQALANQSGDLLTFKNSGANTVANVSSNGALKSLVYPLIKASNYSLTAADVGSFLNNSGTSTPVTNSLPASAIGYQYGLTVLVAQICTFRANGSDTIRNAGSVSTAGGGITANTVGSHLHIYCPVAGQWVVDSITGSWTTF